MKVLMFGWEFPPYFAGGVGVVCYNLTKSLSQLGANITFVMPSGPDEVQSDYVRLYIAENQAKKELLETLTIKRVPSLLSPYTDSATYKELLDYYEGKFLFEAKHKDKKVYGENLLEEIFRFAIMVKNMDFDPDYDVIHAHDWTTFPAAVEIKKRFNIPLIVHIHITEFDKCGGMFGNPAVFEIEREGMRMADKIIAVSHIIKRRLIESYGIEASKIEVIHNGGADMPLLDVSNHPLKKDDRVVLFAGRMTLQKGPDYFVEAARLVLMHEHNVKFIMAGTGDMLPKIIEKVMQYGLHEKFIFTGFFDRKQAEFLFNLADVFVMPSVSEPFGIVPLEAMSTNTPTIISKQSGVSEVLSNVLKVDFWDTQKIANNIVAILRHKVLSDTLVDHGQVEVRGLSWDKPAQQCMNLYGRLSN